ncbi:FecR family protein [Chitinophaga pinensis]|uniref:Anti-FecI sigma factor, FecR n=1 Tax=Chitinophaga pinensis (strain ATCC 43595 / DSM 2588 / LMG 13176 / NBRC 15968 / NCIMB 11800 / UQM 2034) TaxID=485918 RepID=A0A979G471_CHIPD|nr:FecR domain-containing protein [Chitinophaga pinensis]ACU60627.1 anti-FecI sigma factor, FecR [Chitinophaga pinensis DSM 2588]
MKIDPEHIRTLTLYEKGATITPEEQEYLYEAVVQNEEAKQIYRELMTDISQEELNRVSTELKADIKVRLAAAKQKKQRAKVISITATAVAAAVLAGVAILPVVNKNEPTRAPLAHAKANNDIELKIGDAAAINLGAQQGVIKSGNATLNNSNQQLSLVDAAGDTRLATLTVPNGKEYVMALPDGSTVHLNAATSLKFPLSFTGSSREITISGEAYITVKKDAARPFLVHLPHGTVQVLGTEFNINTYNQQEDRVALVSGSIRVRSGNDSSLVKPGYETVADDAPGLAVDQFDPYDVLSWRKGEFPFTNASLKEVAVLIERFYGIPVVFEGSTSAQQFTGVISRKTPVNNFLTGLKLTGFVKEFSFDKDGTLHVK